MENASKALLIAGGVLIAMIVASFGVYLYGVYHEHSENMLAAMSEKEISQFNAKFTIYEEKELTANEVVSIMNLVRENNKSKTGEEYQINIDWGNADGSRYDFSASLALKFKNLDSILEKDYQKNCIEFINEYSKIAEIEKKNSTGATVEEVGYAYSFFLKITNYNSTTKLVNNILIQGMDYKQVP